MNFPTEKGINYKYMVIPMKNNFILLVSECSNDNKIVHIFIDNNFLTKCIANFEDLFFDIKDG